MPIDIKKLTAQYWNSEYGARRTECVCFGGGLEMETDYRTYFEAKHLKKIVPFDRNMSLLELGSGNGRWAPILAPLVAQYEGVDFSEILLRKAKRTAEENGLKNVHFHQCSVTEFSSDKQYDVIYFSSVIQYLSDDDVKKTLANLAPCIKPTTVIVECSTLRHKKREVRKREVQNKGTYFSIYRTPEEIIDIFAASGFRLYYQKRTYRFLRGARSLNRFFFRGPFVPLRIALAAFIRATRPFSLYSMLWFSVVADIVWPSPWNEGDGSFDYFLFKLDESS